jgi:selenocysteine-specific translation elongation factor
MRMDEVKLKTLIKTTTISDFKFLDNIHQLKEEMSRLEPKSLEGDCIIPIDHAFSVKGIGTVILGVDQFLSLLNICKPCSC